MLKILILSNEQIFRNTLAEKIKASGCVIVQSGYVPEALAIAKNENPRIILFDMSIPDVDSLQIYAELRRILPDVKCSMITCSEDVEKLEDEIKKGKINSTINSYRMEGILKRENAFISAVLDTIGSMVIVFDLDGRIRRFNKACERLTGYSFEEVRNRSFWDFLLPAGEMEQTKLVFEYLRINKLPNNFETYWITKKGEKRLISLTNTIILNDQDMVEYIIGAGIDVTEQRRLEKEKENLQARLINSEKMAGIGTLAAGIAHEFNNLLASIRGSAEFCLKTKRGEDLNRSLNLVLDVSKRASKITNALLIFSQGGLSERKPRGIVEIIESILESDETGLAEHRIEVIRKYEQNPVIEVNESEMRQVFINLMTNARDAMRDKGGKLEISVSKTQENAQIVFTDTGIGIKRENLSKLFEAFFTTKGALGGSYIHGTGLGLYVSYWVLKNHNGTIEARSSEGEGSSFIIKLPLGKPDPGR